MDGKKINMILIFDYTQKFSIILASGLVDEKLSCRGYTLEMAEAIKIEKTHSYHPNPDSYREGEGLILVNLKLYY